MLYSLVTRAETPPKSYSAAESQLTCNSKHGNKDRVQAVWTQPLRSPGVAKPSRTALPIDAQAPALAGK